MVVRILADDLDKYGPTLECLPLLLAREYDAEPVYLTMDLDSQAHETTPTILQVSSYGPVCVGGMNKAPSTPFHWAFGGACVGKW